MTALRPEDFVITTGGAHSVQDFIEAAFSAVGLDWRKHVVVDESLRRPPDGPLGPQVPALGPSRRGRGAVTPPRV